MEPRIETLGPKKLVGMRLEMTLATDRTATLWQRFMPRRAEVPNRLGRHFLSMQVFDLLPDQPFTPETPFEKWAAVEVSDHADVPAGMEPYTLSGGKYAVFVHHGPASSFAQTSGYIFGVWLPQSGYELDRREHFELLGEAYRPDDQNAEEEVWIPIR